MPNCRCTASRPRGKPPGQTPGARATGPCQFVTIECACALPCCAGRSVRWTGLAMCRVRRSATRGRLAGASVGAHGRRRPPPPQPAECETATDHAVDRPNATVTRPEALLRIAPSAQAGARPCSTRLEPAYIHAATALCCTLTPRSSRVPTPGHQACGPEWLIIRPAGLVPRRRDRLTSNVRPHQKHLWPTTRQNSQISNPTFDRVPGVSLMKTRTKTQTFGMLRATQCHPPTARGRHLDLQPEVHLLSKTR